MNPAEIEFLAENTLVEIVPRFSCDAIPLLGREAGPFIPNVPTSVPLWLALQLRQQHKCRLVPPAWLSPDPLEALKETERGSPLFAAMPDPHCFEIAALVLHNAVEDVPRSEEVRTLLKDLLDLRQAKLRQSADAFMRSGAPSAKVDNTTMLELHAVRALLTKALDQASELAQAARESGER